MNWVDFKNINQDLLRTKGFFHFSFWVMFYFFMVLIDQSSDYPTWFILVDKLVDTTFYVFIVYVNILYFIPTFLQKGNLLLYLILLVTLVFLLTPIQILASIILYKEDPILGAEIYENKTLIFLRNLLIGLISSGYKVTSDWFGLQNEKKELERQNLQSELKFLKSQINPHFFFNTLNNLYALTLKKSDLAPEIVLRLSEMMRYMLYESNEKEVSLDKEVNYVKNYIELEKLRQGENFKVDFELKGTPNGKSIAPLMFIPFLENSFKHGLDAQINEGYVNIYLDLKEDSVEMDIQNSKPKNNLPTKKLKSGGIGLENVQRRLKLLYPDRHNLEIKNEDDSFNVSLRIELN